MNTHNAATRYLQAVGALLISLGLIHLAATPHIATMLRGSPVAVYERAVGPTLLNHVLAGILLVPLGFTTWLAAVASERGEGWAWRVLVVNTVVVFALPLSIAVFMHRPEYYRAPLFLSGALLAVLISLLMAVATLSLVRRQCRRDHR
jgi:hypothetical protein